jgi:hypothetical protein
MADGIIIDTPEGIRVYRLLALRGMLSLECRGLTRRGTTAYAQIKREFGFRGNRERVYTQFCEYVEKQKELYGDRVREVRD